MDYKDRWTIIDEDELGKGGQGKVFLVRDHQKADVFKIYNEILKSIKAIVSIQGELETKRSGGLFHNAMTDMIDINNPKNLGALKVLHEPKNARDSKLAEARLKKEIEGMSSISHPNLLKIINYDPDLKWYVSQYHPKRTLIDNPGLFTGNFVEALKAFRPLVEGVCELHNEGFVHRDINPRNVFIDSANNLVLGDFGLLFFDDPQHTRLSQTFENVGSRDWMPGWGMGIRIEDVKPDFDVFSLGKLLWAMVSNKLILQLWYYYKPEFNLEEMFPNAPAIKLANTLFNKCIVEEKDDCLPDANALLEEVDKVLHMIDRHADPIGDEIMRSCKVCGKGNYTLFVDQESISSIRHFGLSPGPNQRFKIFFCSHCGHVQLFSYRPHQPPPAWVS